MRDSSGHDFVLSASLEHSPYSLDRVSSAKVETRISVLGRGLAAEVLGVESISENYWQLLSPDLRDCCLDDCAEVCALEYPLFRDLTRSDFIRFDWAPDLERRKFFEETVTFCCDGKCDKAWGVGDRPSQSAGPHEDDIVYLADDELGIAPANPGTSEGGHLKPSATPIDNPALMNKTLRD